MVGRMNGPPVNLAEPAASTFLCLFLIVGPIIAIDEGQDGIRIQFIMLIKFENRCCVDVLFFKKFLSVLLLPFVQKFDALSILAFEEAGYVQGFLLFDIPVEWEVLVRHSSFQKRNDVG